MKVSASLFEVDTFLKRANKGIAYRNRDQDKIHRHRDEHGYWEKTRRIEIKNGHGNGKEKPE